MISLDSESESVGLLDFKRLGVYDPGSRAVPSGEKEDDIGKILVHQARYMIFDNSKLCFFSLLLAQISLLTDYCRYNGDL